MLDYRLPALRTPHDRWYIKMSSSQEYRRLHYQRKVFFFWTTIHSELIVTFSDDDFDAAVRRAANKIYKTIDIDFKQPVGPAR